MMRLCRHAPSWLWALPIDASTSTDEPSTHHSTPLLRIAELGAVQPGLASLLGALGLLMGTLPQLNRMHHGGVLLAGQGVSHTCCSKLLCGFGVSISLAQWPIRAHPRHLLWRALNDGVVVEHKALKGIIPGPVSAKALFLLGQIGFILVIR